MGYKTVYNESISDSVKIPCYFDFTKREEKCYDFLDEFTYSSAVRNSYYLLHDPRLTWIRNDKNQFKDVPSVIELTTIIDGVIYDRYFYGRTWMGKKYYLGHVDADEKKKYEFRFLDYSSKFSYQAEAGFEVLACAPIKNAPCGEFRLFS